MIKCMDKVVNKYGNICDCDKEAKYKTPRKSLGRVMFLCGIHKHSHDIMYKNAGLDIKCLPITAEDEEDYIKNIKTFVSSGE